MPKFLEREEIYDIIQRELPESVYPDGAATGFYSTADSDSQAKVIESAYSNLERIYDNYFPGWADEKISDWEITCFGERLSSTLTISEKRALIKAQLRLRPDVSVWSTLTAVLDIVPFGTVVQVFEFCKFDGGWELGESGLGFDTFLDGFEKIVLDDTSLYCNPESLFDGWHLGVSELGNTTELGGASGDGLSGLDWGYQQVSAYTSVVRVFGYTLTNSERSAIEDLRVPGRSQRFISDDLDIADFDLNTLVTDVEITDNVNCMFKDAGSSTGYSGRIADVDA